jgi:hypothetical protein
MNDIQAELISPNIIPWLECFLLLDPIMAIILSGRISGSNQINAYTCKIPTTYAENSSEHKTYSNEQPEPSC